MPATITSMPPRRSSGPPRPRPAALAPPPVSRQSPADPRRHRLPAPDPRGARRARQSHAFLFSGFPDRVRPLRADRGRSDDARGAPVRAGAQHHQADRRAAARAAVRAVPRQAGRAAAGHDAGAGHAGPDCRQRAHPHQHRPLVQRADGRHPDVGEPDRQRLLPAAAGGAGRSCRPHSPRARADRPHARRRAVDPRGAGAGSDAAARPDAPGLPRRAAERIAADAGAGGRRGRAPDAARLQPRNRRPPGRPGAARRRRDGIDRSARAFRRSPARRRRHPLERRARRPAWWWPPIT